MEIKHILYLSLFLLLVVLADGKKGKSKSNAKNGEKKISRKSIQSVATCWGQPVNFTSHLQSVDACVEKKVKDAMNSTAPSKGSDKKSKKKEGKQAKFTNKMRKKCMAECEWTAFGLLPNATSQNTYDASKLDFSKFLKIFPENGRENLKSALMPCYNSTAMDPTKEGHKCCLRNRRLTKCLLKTLKRTCSSSAPGSPPPKLPIADDESDSDSADVEDNQEGNGNATTPGANEPVNNNNVTEKPINVIGTTTPAPAPKKSDDDSEDDDDSDE